MLEDRSRSEEASRNLKQETKCYNLEAKILKEKLEARNQKLKAEC